MKPPIPANLNEAVDTLLANMTPQQQADYAKVPEDHLGSYFHFGGGMVMRNNWDLWRGKTPISKWLRAHRIYHGDDCSAVIYKALWRRLRGLSIGDDWLAKEAAFYEQFWNHSGLTWDQKPLDRQPRLTLSGKPIVPHAP